MYKKLRQNFGGGDDGLSDEWTGLNANVNGADAECVLVPFADGVAIDAWAKQAVAATVLKIDTPHD